MDGLQVYSPDVWLELITKTIGALTAGIIAVIAALNAGKIADASSSGFSKVIDLIRDWRKK